MKRAHLLRILVVTAISLTTLMVGAGSALACSCIMPEPQNLLETSDGAFVGTVIERPSEPNGVIISDADTVPWVFEVEEAYKGEIESPMVVMSAISSAACGLAMAEGDSASIFISRVGDEWHGNLCQAMGPEALLESEFVTIEWGTADTSETTTVARWALAGLAAIGVGGVVLTRIRRSQDTNAIQG